MFSFGVQWTAPMMGRARWKVQAHDDHKPGLSKATGTSDGFANLETFPHD